MFLGERVEGEGSRGKRKGDWNEGVLWRKRVKVEMKGEGK
jgi:hypothetical protein